MARKKRKKKSAVSRPVLFLVIGLCLFLALQLYLLNNNTLTTQIASQMTVYDSVSTRGLFIRDETVMDNFPDAGTPMVQSVDNGAKVRAGEEIAKTFASETQAQNYVKKQELETEIAYYQDIQSQALGETTDLESLDKKILEQIHSLIQAKNEEILSAAAQTQSDLNDAMLRRQLITGTEIDFDSKISELQAQAAALDIAHSSTVSASMTGTFSAMVDGYEDLVDYSQVDSLTIESVNSYLDQTSGSGQVGRGGKIITNFNWYIACVVDSSAVAALNEGSSLKVYVDEYREMELSVTVYAKIMESVTAQECVLILRCNEMSEELSALRNEAIELRIKSYEGLKVESDAIRVIDGEKSVFVLLTNKVVQRSIEEIYIADDYVIVKIDNTDSDNIQLYDQVIVKGKDLYDGKLIN
ncbi:MAG: hypothetical protein LIO46_03595 [Clostridiales bacterium]|nr:hypothetical protein [Clostridiales bacterium]